MPSIWYVVNVEVAIYRQLWIKIVVRTGYFEYAHWLPCISVIQ